MNGSPISYSVLVDTIYGKMHVNRYDINQTNALIKTGAAIDAAKINMAVQLCEFAPPDAIILDIGANFGTYSLACAKALSAKNGLVHAYEGQRIISYMLASSVALNAYENVFVHNQCVGDSAEPVALPKFSYDSPMNFGSVEFGPSQRERLDQERQESIEMVDQIRIDDQNYRGVFFVKIDVEGMEDQVLAGAVQTIERERPVCLVEYMKSDAAALADFFIPRRYSVFNFDGDFLCIPEEFKVAVNLEEYYPGMPLLRLV